MFHYDPIMFVGDTLSILFCDTLSFCDTFSNYFFCDTLSNIFAIHFKPFYDTLKKAEKNIYPRNRPIKIQQTSNFN